MKHIYIYKLVGKYEYIVDFNLFILLSIVSYRSSFSSHSTSIEKRREREREEGINY